LTEHAAAADMIHRLRDDSGFVVRELLGENPWQAQLDIMESVRRNFITSVASCHGAGKSYIAARVVIDFLMEHGPDTIVITTAPTDRQVRGILWQEIRGAAGKLAKRINLSSSPLTTGWDLGRDVKKKWFALGFASRDYDPTAASGWHAGNVLVVYDEAAGMSDDVIDGLDGCVSNPRTCRVLKIGNPTDPSSEFGREHKHAGGSFNISAFDTPNFTSCGITEEDMRTGEWREKAEQPGSEPYPMLVTPAWVAHVRSKWGESNPLYIAKVLGQFPSDDPHGLFPMSLLARCHAAQIEPQGAGLLSLDVGREGDDPSILGHRRGLHYRKLREFRGMRLSDLRVEVQGEADRLGVEAIRIDSIGIGAGPADEMEEAGYRVDRINFSEGSTRPEEYFNYRSECFFHLRDVMDEQEIDLDPDDDDLTAQLAAITYGPHGKNDTVRVTPKEQIKRRLRRSIDDADAIAIAYAPSKPDEPLGIWV